MVLNDCHGEVLARRSLHKTLYKEIAWLKSGQGVEKCVLLQNSEDIGKYKMRQGVKLHMYVSEPPCGDSSILESTEEGHGVHWTGAKPLQVDGKENGKNLMIGICRLKTARSDIP